MCVNYEVLRSCSTAFIYNVLSLVQIVYMSVNYEVLCLYSTVKVVSSFSTANI